MTIEEIKQRVADIDRHRGDDERAHSEEDDLFTEFIEFIASGSIDDETSVMAAEVLKTKNIEFARWCA